MSKRLPTLAGEWIDRSRLIAFTFEGQRFQGFQGDTISSALWATGHRILGRSFKYHRPRGVLSFANHDINAMMQLESPGDVNLTLNVRADVTEIIPGMNLVAVNTDGGVMADRLSFLSHLSAFLPVGFYYKTFHNKRLFPFWERLIRQMTGLGTLDFTTPRQRTPKRYDFCDVLVIGAGPSGLAAAIAVADAGADVILVDENPHPGGSGHYQRGGAVSQFDQTNGLIQTVAAHSRIRFYPRTQAAGYYADHWVPLIHRDYMTKLRAQAVIVATGSYEQPAVFRNNDLPGIMLASAAQRLIYRYAVQPMQRAIVLTANSDGYRAALDCLAQGIEIAAIVDLNVESPKTQAFQQLQAQGIPIWSGHCVYEAKTHAAQDGVTAAVVCPLDEQGQPQPQQARTFPCDGILMSVGWVPAANLLYQAGTKMKFDDRLQQFVPDQLAPGVFACGRVNGVYDFEAKLRDGHRAGQQAAEYLQLSPHLPTSSSQERGGGCPSHPWPIVPHPQGKNFIDFDEDLQLKDFQNAIQEGFDNIELLKRYTTVGMGPSQGKHSNMNALRILARVTHKTPGVVGTTTARPFFHPVPLSHLAGRGFTPERRTSLHSRHIALGAKFMPAGPWLRPEYYTQTGMSRQDCIIQEVRSVRSGVGMIDVGTLGKLELRGPDAAEFLERIYTGRFANMKPGTTRYAVMLDEAGVIIDDGVVACLGPNHFYFTTTTSGAAQVYRELSRLNTVWQLNCGLVNLTGARVAINLAGPRSQVLLSQLTDMDLSAAAFPYLAVRQGSIAGIPALVMRVGFVGEWGYEIHVAAEYGPALWDALMSVGKAFDITPFGVEAQRLLRLEKGHLIVGQDTDGVTTPIEANLNWAVKLDKPFFIGQRSLQIVKQRSAKYKLVGFVLDQNFGGPPPQECHLVIDGEEIAGRITSIAFSPNLQRYIGLAYVKPALSEVGQSFLIRRSDRTLVNATVHPTPFYDPENLRQKNEPHHLDQALNLPAAPQLVSETNRTVRLPKMQVGVSITDVSHLNRFGVKGPGAIAWLQNQGLLIPDRPNTWLPLPDGGLIARLGMTEFLIEESGPVQCVTNLTTAEDLPLNVYPVLRQDLAISLSGEAVQELLLQTCNVNFRLLDLAERPVVLTSMIGVSVTVVPDRQADLPVYRIWCDNTFGDYVWQTLTGISEELGGCVIGCDRKLSEMREAI